MENLKSAFFKGKFDQEFIDLAKKELPSMWGRLSALEEFYSLTKMGGDPDRIPQLYGQLGEAKQFHGSPLRKLWTALVG